MTLQVHRTVLQCDKCGAVYDLDSQIDAWFHGKSRIRKGDKCLMQGCHGHIREVHR